jgi:hypothetical protein
MPAAPNSAAHDRVIGGRARQADLPGHASEIDDVAAAPGRHLRGQRGDQEIRRADVGREEPVEGRHIEVRGRPEPTEPGVVHQDVDRAHLLDEVVELGGVAEVRGDETGLATVGGDRVDHRFAASGVPTRNDHLRALPSELLGNGLADAGGASRDQRGQALEVSLSTHGESLLDAR